MTGKPDSEDEVWRHEAAYWGYAESANLDSFLSFWHEDGIAWYSSQSIPLNKAGFRQHVADALARLRSDTLSFKPNPLSVRVYGDTAITYFELHTRAIKEDGSEFIEHERATHTWLRTENGWKLISGMQSPLAGLEII